MKAEHNIDWNYKAFSQKQIDSLMTGWFREHNEALQSSVPTAKTNKKPCRKKSMLLYQKSNK
jgi:hypothetical protein